MNELTNKLYINRCIKLFILLTALNLAMPVVSQEKIYRCGSAYTTEKIDENCVLITSSENSNKPHLKKAQKIDIKAVILDAESRGHLTFWKQETITDKFTGTAKVIFSVMSRNTQNVGVTGEAIKASIIVFPYSPAGNYPIKLYFSGASQPLGLTDAGHCFSGSCTVSAKFDGGEIKKYEAFEPSDLSGSRHQLFIQDISFIKNAFLSKKIEIRVPFYSKGNGDFEFILDK